MWLFQHDLLAALIQKSYNTVVLIAGEFLKVIGTKMQ